MKSETDQGKPEKHVPAQMPAPAATAHKNILKRRFHIVKLEERVTPGNGGGGHETSHGGGLY